MIISFENNEEELMNSVLSALEIGRKTYKVENAKLSSSLTFGDILIFVDKREVFRNKQKVNLTYTEFEILRLLAQNSGKVFSKEQIYDIVWKEPYSGDYNIVMSHIRNIREKIEDNPSKPAYIQTVWGVGYRFNQNMSSGL